MQAVIESVVTAAAVHLTGDLQYRSDYDQRASMVPSGTWEINALLNNQACDGLGHRGRKTAGGIATHFVFDGEGRRVDWVPGASPEYGSTGGGVRGEPSRPRWSFDSMPGQHQRCRRERIT